MTQIDTLLGKSISQQRLKIGISQADLANKLGLSVYTVAAFEDGSRRASAKQLFEIAEILDVNVARLFDQPEKEQPETTPSTPPSWEEVGALTGHYDALTTSHRAAIFAFLLALRADQ